MKQEKRGIFLKRNCHVDSQKEFSLQNRKKMMERLVLYKNVEYIRTSIKKENYAEFIISQAGSHMKKEESLEYLSKRASLGRLMKELPSYFIQINQSQIINALHITGRSQSFLFTNNRVLEITKPFKKEANIKLNTFYDIS
jgi:hypothetical protein